MSKNSIVAVGYGTREATYLGWQERLSEHDGGRARDPRYPQDRCETFLNDSQNSFLGPRPLNQGAVRQKYRDLNGGDDEQTRGQHPQLCTRSGSPGEGSVHSFGQGVA